MSFLAEKQKIGGVSPPNHPFVHRGFPLFSPSILGGLPPLFLVQHPNKPFSKHRGLSSLKSFESSGSNVIRGKRSGRGRLVG